MNRRDLLGTVVKGIMLATVINPVATLAKPLTVKEYIEGKIARGETLENETFLIEETINIPSDGLPLYIKNCDFIISEKVDLVFNLGSGRQGLMTGCRFDSLGLCQFAVIA